MLVEQLPAKPAPPTPGVDLTTKELRDLGCGRQLGEYILLRRLAVGGMAEVYVARARGPADAGERVAIKKILPQHAHNERFVTMLIDEAKITVSLTHPNIAQFYELGLDGEDAYFIVMEYVEGRPLNKLMQRVDERGLATISVEHAAHIMSEVARGLDHAHKQRDPRGVPLQIVHRDISPQNVLISYRGDVKLIDFGIARAEGRIAQTSHGVIKGKLRYLAPEIAAGEEPDHRADIYCCGIVLFEMLTGEAMFAPRTDLEAIEMASQARVRSPRASNPKVPEELDAIVLRALRRDRSERYQSAWELHNDLRRFLRQQAAGTDGRSISAFMQSMFEAEILQERRLDAQADRVSRLPPAGDPTPSEEPPTLAGSVADDADVSALRERRRLYKRLVTRVGIGVSENKQEVRLAGADGGQPMQLVLADDPPPRSDSIPRELLSTMPPQSIVPSPAPAVSPELSPAPAARAGDFDDVAPTQRAPIPFDPERSAVPTVRTPPSGLEVPAASGRPTVRGPSDRPLERAGGPPAERGDRAAEPSKIMEALQGQVRRTSSAKPAKDPSDADLSGLREARARKLASTPPSSDQVATEIHVPSETAASARVERRISPRPTGPSRTWLSVAISQRASSRPSPALASSGPWGYVFFSVAFAAVLACALFAGLFRSGVESEATPAAAEAPQLSAVPDLSSPPPPPAPSSSLRLQVRPDVAVDVDVDGAHAIRNGRPPILLSNLIPGVPHVVRVRAKGFVAEQLTKTLVAGSTEAVDIELAHAHTKIIIHGAAPGSIAADQGRVEGTEILDLPVGAEVEIRVRRPNAADWIDQIDVPSATPVEVTIPKVPRGGLLSVSAHPTSMVLVNGKRRGQTPIKLRLPPGKYKITLEAPDGERWTTIAKVGASKATVLQHRW